MKNKSKHNAIALGFLILVVAILGIGAFYGITQSVVLVGKGWFNMESSFVALVGTETSVYDMMNQVKDADNAKEYIATYNLLIDNVYGYAVLDSPVKVSSSTTRKMAQEMSEFNSEIKQPSSYKTWTRQQKSVWNKAFGKGVWTSTLQNTIKKRTYTYNDLVLIGTELDKSANQFCNGFVSVYKSGLFPEEFNGNEDSMQYFMQFCEKKPAKMFVKVADGYTFNLPDMDIYQYDRYDVVCEASKDALLPNAPQCKQGEYCIYQYPAPADTPNAGQMIGQYYQCYDNVCAWSWMCHYVEKPQVIKEFMGTIQFSKMNFKIKKIGNQDVGIALGASGIKGLSSIKEERYFENYFKKMPINQSININTNDWVNEEGFLIITNNDAIKKITNDVVDTTGNR